MKFKTSLVCCAVMASHVAFAQTELIVNGGFESGLSPWQIAGSTGAGVLNDSPHAHGGSSYLSMGNSPGASQAVFQSVVLPTNAVFATLSYFWSATSSDTTGNDEFRSLVSDTNQNILAIVDTEFNSNADGAYHKKTFDLTPYIGQTVRIYFEDFSDPTYGQLTSFHVDDVSVSYVVSSNLPANDNFTNRTALSGTTTTATANNSFATKEPGEPDHAANPGGRSLWWSWTAPTTNGTVILTTAGSTFDTLLAVYTGSSLTNLTLVGANDDDSSSGSALPTSRVKFAALAGTTYQIAVDGKNGASGSIALGLSFQRDSQKPTVSISTPAAGAKVTGTTVVVKGKASDNIGVAFVEYRLENALGTNDYQNAVGTNTWTATITNLAPGVNVVRVQAVDVSGNVSKTVARSFKYVVTSPFTLTITGIGTVSPNLSGHLLEINTTYKLTAKPGAGQIFAGWTGDIESTSAKLAFVMQTNLTLQASFIPNPFLPAVGSYQGLFYDTNDVANESSGFFSAAVTTAGKFSAKIQLVGKRYSASGQFSATGAWSNAIPRKGQAQLTLELQLDLLGGGLTGEFHDTNWTAELMANRGVYSKSNPAPQAGRYTLLIPGNDDSTAQPGGESFGAVTVASAGSISFKGSLADGTKVAQKTVISGAGKWPFFLSPYVGKGVVTGWLAITNETDSDLRGPVRWIKLPSPKAKYYPAGFTNDAEAVGSSYVFTKGSSVLNFTAGQVWLAEGGLSQSFTNQITLDARNKVTNLSANKLSVSISTSTGLFNGRITDPVSEKSISINGAVFQKLNAGYGFFLGTNQSGRVYFGP